MITLSKDGIFYKNRWEDDKKKKVESLLPFLSKKVQIEGVFTLEDLFKIIEKDKEIMNIIFSSQLGHYPLQAYIDDINKEPEALTINEPIEFLQVSWMSGYEQGECSDFNPENEICLGADFGGWGVWEESPWTNQTPEEDGKMRGRFAIEFTPLFDLKHIPLRLILDVIFQDDRKFNKEKNEYEVILEGKRHFTVYEMIGAILFEISFSGDPENRDKAWKKAYGEIEEMKDNVENKVNNTDELFKELNSD